MDFVADRLVSGARFTALTVVDVFTKGCLAFVGRALDVWAYVNKVRIDFARPGKPTHNAYVKSFNGRLRALGKGRR
jgi:putative transposase